MQMLDDVTHRGEVHGHDGDRRKGLGERRAVDESVGRAFRRSEIGRPYSLLLVA
jgi:hypothetical protein